MQVMFVLERPHCHLRQRPSVAYLRTSIRTDTPQMPRRFSPPVNAPFGCAGGVPAAIPGEWGRQAPLPNGPFGRRRI